MSNNIPSSLKWLVDKRKRISGKLTKLQEETQIMVMTNESAIAEYKSQLKALDEVIKLHEINIDVNKIAPIRPSQKKKYLRYGVITKAIYECLGSAKKNGLKTTQVVDFIISKIQSEEIDIDKEYKSIRLAVRHRLKTLYHQKKITKAIEGVERRWFIV